MHAYHIYVRGPIHLPTECLTLALYGCILCVHAIMHAQQAIIMQSNAIIAIDYYGIQRNMNVIHCQMKATLAAMRCMGQPIKQLHN